MAKAHRLSPKEYQQKRYEAAKELLAASITQGEKINAFGEDKQLESLVSNCIGLADSLLHDLGYESSDPDSASVHSLKDLLQSEQDDEAA